MPEVRQPSQPACLQSVSRESTQARKSTSWNGDKLDSFLNKDVKKVIRRVVREQGWAYRASVRGKHPQVVSPEGDVVVLSSTMGEGRALANMKAELKRKGAEL